MTDILTTIGWFALGWLSGWITVHAESWWKRRRDRDRPGELITPMDRAALKKARDRAIARGGRLGPTGRPLGVRLGDGPRCGVCGGIGGTIDAHDPICPHYGTTRGGLEDPAKPEHS